MIQVWFQNQWCCDSMKWKFLRSPLFHWAEYLTMHLFLFYVLGPLEFFAWRAENQVLSLQIDANWHRTCRVCTLCCHCIILYHEEVISHFIFAETQIFWMYKGQVMQRRRHQPLTTILHCGSFLLWPSYSTGVDLNKDLLTLYIPVCIPFPSRE